MKFFLIMHCLILPILRVILHFNIYSLKNGCKINENNWLNSSSKYMGRIKVRVCLVNFI